MSKDFEVVKCYYEDIYTGWTVKEPKKYSDFGYFIKVDGLYFLLGCKYDNYIMEDEY